MDQLYQFSATRIRSVSTDFRRYLFDLINWDDRLIAISGARGVGKTTMLLQYIKLRLRKDPDEVIFVNMDDLHFSKTSLVTFAGDFVKRGRKYLFMDEIHKYPAWSPEIKNIYDYYPDLKVVITGSSALDIFRGTADLSRRAMVYNLHGLSFREFILLKHKKDLPVISLEQLLHEPARHTATILEAVKPIKLFEDYLESGYYPYFMEGEKGYHTRMRQTVNQVLESDLPAVENMDYQAVFHLKRLLSVITEIVPFKPNIHKLSRQLGLSRPTLMKYLSLLERANLLMLLQPNTHGISRMNKPEKIYLNNTNLMFALTDGTVNKGTLRETFFLNQVASHSHVRGAEKGDFLIDGKYTVEVGGRNKPGRQVEGIPNAFIAADNIEHPHGNMIPLWLFGFLY